MHPSDPIGATVRSGHWLNYENGSKNSGHFVIYTHLLPLFNQILISAALKVILQT